MSVNSQQTAAPWGRCGSSEEGATWGWEIPPEYEDGTPK